ncbi:MAG TPA: hypothetical protein VL588_04070 [Bdellovibrionota bacterium]|nr:hypothetical protein [Bdellovibrionota bacterium]
MYLLKIALRPWRVAPLSQGLGAATAGFLLLMMGLLIWVDRGLAPAVEHLRNDSVATVYLAPPAQGETADGPLKAVRAVVGPEVTARFVDRAQFVGELKGTYPQLADQLLELGSEMNTVVPRYITVSGALGDDTVARLRSLPGVLQVDRSEGRSGRVFSAIHAMRWLARVLALAIGAAVIAALSQMARMNWGILGESTSLLRLWGGGELASRLPGVVAGLVAGGTAGALTLALWFPAGGWIGARIRALSPLLASLPAPGGALPLTLALAAVLIGGAAALLGAWSAARGGDR